MGLCLCLQQVYSQTQTLVGSSHRLETSAEASVAEQPGKAAASSRVGKDRLLQLLVSSETEEGGRE